MQDLADATAGRLLDATALSAVTGISIDSRTCKPGDLFIALAGDPGPRFNTSSPGSRDGHEFVSAARAAGAVACLVQGERDASGARIEVADTLDALWALGHAARERLTGDVFAVTGSSGKTTAKGFLAAATQGFASAGSLNNFWGVPLSLARTPADAAAAVYEIGTNAPGEIAPLTGLVQPTVAMLLNVHPAHIGNFLDMVELTKEKLSINSTLRDLSRFVCEYAVAADAGLANRCITFGAQDSAAVRLLEVSGDRARLRAADRRLDARVPGGGRHRALTLCGVVAALLAAGREPEPALDLPTDLVPPGRGTERLLKGPDGQRWTLVDDSYNANPASMAAALETLAAAGEPGYAILGEMLELGEASAALHESLAAHCEALAGVICVGAGSLPLYNALPDALRLGYVAAVADLDVAELRDRLPARARLLVKGSNRVFWASSWCDTLAVRLVDPESA